MRSTTVRLSDDLYARIKEQSERQGVPMSHLIRDAMVAALTVQGRTGDGERLDELERRVERVEARLGMSNDDGG